MLESAYGVHTTVGLIAFWLGVVAAFHDGLLFDPPDVPDVLRLTIAAIITPGTMPTNRRRSY